MDQDQLYNEIMEERDLSLDVLTEKEGINEYGRVYLFTNELMAGLMGRLDFKGKSVLGVAGCGDFMISAMTEGCNDFTGVDISIPACFFAELKFAGVKTLDYDSFRKFFGLSRRLARAFPDPAEFFKEKGHVENVDMFSAETYETLREELSETAQNFFDSVMYSHCIGLDGKKLPFALQYLFPQMPFTWSMNYVPYLENRKVFDLTQTNLGKKPLLYPKDIRKVAQRLDRKFDFIYTSNVHQWFNQDISEGAGVVFLDDLVQNLKPEGKLVVFGLNSCNDTESLAYMGHRVEEIENGRALILKEMLKQSFWFLRGAKSRELPLSYYKAHLVSQRENF